MALLKLAVLNTNKLIKMIHLGFFINCQDILLLTYFLTIYITFDMALISDLFKILTNGLHKKQTYPYL